MAENVSSNVNSTAEIETNTNTNTGIDTNTNTSIVESQNISEIAISNHSSNSSINGQGLGLWKSIRAYLCLLVSGLGVGWLAGLSVSPIIHTVLGAVISLIVAIVAGLASSEEARVESDQEQNSSTQVNISLKWLEEIVFNKKVNPFPLAVTVLGVCVGVSFGIYIRTNDYLGINPNNLTAIWAKDGLEKAEVRRHIFDQLYPTTNSKFSMDLGIDPDNLVNLWAKDGLEKAEVRRRLFDQLYPTIDSSNKNTTTDKGEKVTLFEKESSEQGEKNVSIERVKQISTSLFGVKLSEKVNICDLINNREGKELKTKLLETDDDAIKALVENCNNKGDCLKAIKELLCPGSK